MVHGGEIYGNQKIEYDFSVNINPLGMPAEAAQAVRESIPRLTQYPDPDCGALRRALEAFTGVPGAQILCGNGASELIEAAVRALHPNRILLTAPSFSGYRHAAEGAGAGIACHRLRREEGFRLTARYLEDLAQKPEMAILCNPANPVGNLIDPDLLLQIVERCQRQGTWLLVDECFLCFVKGTEQRTMRALLMEKKASRLLVLDAFTKRFAMPGLRLGYLMGPDASVMEKIKRQQPEWSVSVPAQAAGCAVLGTAEHVGTADRGIAETIPHRYRASGLAHVGTADRGIAETIPHRYRASGLAHVEAAEREIAENRTSPEKIVETLSESTGSGGLEDYMSRTRALVYRERKRMVSALQGLGCDVFPGEANFILFSSRPDLQDLLLHRGILIRSCDNYPGLGRGDYRIAVLLPDQNAVLLRALEEILREPARKCL